jgi:hypothetical protein
LFVSIFLLRGSLLCSLNNFSAFSISWYINSVLLSVSDFMHSCAALLLGDGPKLQFTGRFCVFWCQPTTSALGGMLEVVGLFTLTFASSG